jgi:hypothetical protein
MVTFLVILAGVMAFSLQIMVVAYAINAKLDWTENKQLLLWYDEYEQGKKVRKFITLIKL